VAGTKRKRRRGYTRLSTKHQVTIPRAALEVTGVKPGDELKVEVSDGHIVLTPSPTLGERRRSAIRTRAGKLRGLYPPDYLDRLRDEWR
jgi:AbrB family looped-hinge helix DNA binding protein